MLDEDGLEIKNKDIFRAKLLIANFFNFEKKSEGVNVATMLKGSLNNSGKDDLSALIGGFEDNYCFDVMQFFNCTFAISKFRNRCIDLFKDSYKEINETYGGYIEDAIEDAQFDAEDAREEKIVSLYHDAINEDKEEDDKESDKKVNDKEEYDIEEIKKQIFPSAKPWATLNPEDLKELERDIEIFTNSFINSTMKQIKKDQLKNFKEIKLLLERIETK